jgi:hypothetical protein
MAEPEPTRGAARRSSATFVVAGAVVAIIVALTRSREAGSPEAPQPEQTKVHIVSEPAGATVVLRDGGVLGVTPFEVLLPKGAGELPADVKLDGYQTRHTTIPLFSETGRIDVALVPVGVDAAPPPKAPPKDWTP